MGGIGSGRRFQSRRGPNLEEVPQLDVRVLKRNGLFDLTASNGSIKWKNTGLSECSLEYTYKDSTLSISYAVKTPQAASETVSEHIFIDRTTCNYGGTRTWFSCLHVMPFFDFLLIKLSGVFYHIRLFACMTNLASSSSFRCHHYPLHTFSSID